MVYSVSLHIPLLLNGGGVPIAIVLSRAGLQKEAAREALTITPQEDRKIDCGLVGNSTSRCNLIYLPI
jgi:hypothetical protein